MRKTCYTRCKKYKEFKKHKISYICDKAFLLSSIFNKSGGEAEKIFKEEESTKILKDLGLIENI